MKGLWDETVKCLFLRVRNPPADAIDDLVIKVFKITNIHSGKATTLIKDTKTTFRDFRNKYNDNVMKLVDSYKKIRYSSYFFVFFTVTDLIIFLINRIFYLFYL